MSSDMYVGRWTYQQHLGWDRKLEDVCDISNAWVQYDSRSLAVTTAIASASISSSIGSRAVTDDAPTWSLHLTVITLEGFQYNSGPTELVCNWNCDLPRLAVEYLTLPPDFWITWCRCWLQVPNEKSLADLLGIRIAVLLFATILNAFVPGSPAARHSFTPVV
ncbi:hypothetical protein BDQ17DRAFT_1429223 [Cyathus striatus]|nr:hypothetical protein BDQ17DRAFT_1429223 [Cyathus striatus]